MKIATIASVSLLAGTASAQHHHLSINTDGTTTIIEAGYLASETDWSIDTNGYVNFQGSINVYHTHDNHGGYSFGNTTTITSDFFAATGNLDGGDFYYELVSLTPVNGGSATNAIWGFAEHGGGPGFDIEGSLDGATRIERSFGIGVGNHPHGQVTGINGTGIYDLAIVAWDANGVYADSAPVTLRINAVPAPASAALFGVAGLAAARRRR
ncbi:MAG: hypothetical protein ED559_00445 [Phycisphaera sp.]|nr:MAG: hypothetical protein ED559_00445 [Phycisphaera sp.]